MPKNLAAPIQHNHRLPHHYQYAELHKINQMLHQQSHLFIVALGTLIGALIALFIAYHLKTTTANVLLLSWIPFALPYLLREIYIYTLIHIQDDGEY